MKIFGKKRLSIRLAVLVAFTMMLSVVPVNSVTVSAATLQVHWYNGETETEVSVEAGSKFYIGDFVAILGKNMSSTASLQKASYKSSNKKIASVNNKGYLKAQKVGMTDVTVTYQGRMLVCHLTVVKKGTFENTTAVKELKAAAKKLAKGMPKKINATKGYKLRTQRNTYYNAYSASASNKISYDGFLYEGERPARATKSDYKRTEQLVVPEAGRYLTAEALLRQYLLDNDPTSIDSKKTMRIASATASSKTGKITIKLTKKLTADQIFAAKLAYPKYNSSTDSKKNANIRISIYDQTTGKYYKGEIVLKSGSKQLTVKPVVYTYGKYESVKLVNGHVYMLGSTMTWANGTRVTAK